ncbi:MAG: diacylglycerol kinase family protein [Myxococcota bacterium]
MNERRTGSRSETAGDASPIRQRIRSFRHAARGLAAMLASEPNARIHALAAIVAIVAGFGFGITRAEWLAVVLSIGLVFVAEGMNTALEALCDVVSPQWHAGIERAKDVAAGAVLFAALTALAVATLVFGPRILSLAALALADV